MLENITRNYAVALLPCTANVFTFITPTRLGLWLISQPKGLRLAGFIVGVSIEGTIQCDALAVELALARMLISASETCPGGSRPLDSRSPPRYPPTSARQDTDPGRYERNSWRRLW